MKKLSRYAAKSNARKLLRHNIFSPNWLGAAFSIAGINIVSNTLIPFSIVLNGPLQYGMYEVYDNLNRTNNFEIKNHIFKGFKENFSESVLLPIIEGIFLMFWSMLFFFPMIIKYYAYSLSMFLMHKEPELNWTQAHYKSIFYMTGYKWQLFVFDLSFIGWYLLGMLCFGVGVLFVIPYHNVARFHFLNQIVDACEEHEKNTIKGYTIEKKLEILEKMKSSLDSGLITQEEYDKFRKKLMDDTPVEDSHDSESKPVQENHAQTYVKPKKKTHYYHFLDVSVAKVIDVIALLVLFAAFIATASYFLGKTIYIEHKNGSLYLSFLFQPRHYYESQLYQPESILSIVFCIISMVLITAIPVIDIAVPNKKVRYILSIFLTILFGITSFIFDVQSIGVLNNLKLPQQIIEPHTGVLVANLVISLTVTLGGIVGFLVFGKKISNEY